MHNNAPTTERFKPAGHKAQELSEIVMPQEVFPPIQRVIDTTLTGDDKTIGYLFRDVKYKRGFVDDVVLSKWGWLSTGEIERSAQMWSWQYYETNGRLNPLGWIVPSGPLIMELCYRSRFGTASMVEELETRWLEFFTHEESWLKTSTTVDYNDHNHTAKIKHDWSDKMPTVRPPSVYKTAITDMPDPSTAQFLQSLLGRRSNIMREIFGRYGTQIELWSGLYGEHALALCAKDGVFKIYADDDIADKWSARGVSLLKNFKSPQYEVQDA